MENDTFNVDTAKSELVAENKEWIEYLFEVDLVLENDTGSTIDPHLCRYKIVTSAPNAQEILVKTKKYINVLTEDIPESTIAIQDQEVVKAAVHFKADIEKTFACVLLVSEDFRCLVVKGENTDVDITQQLLNSIDQWNKSGQPLSNFPFGDVVNQCIYNNSAESSVQNPQLRSRNQVETDSENYHSSNIQSLQTLAISDHPSDNESSTTDDEDLIFEIKSDPYYQSKVEFAVKLGYLESDLIEAIKNIGKDATQNLLLSELIKSSANRDETSDSPAGAVLERSRGSQDEEWIGEAAYKSQIRVDDDDSNPFRHIIMDGSNIAMSHCSKEVFSCRGIQLAVNWFQERGHTNITVFVPQWRKETSRSDARIRDQQILTELENEGIVVFTPSRRIGGKRVVCYDDRYILKLAVDTDGIVVSNDNYRDLMTENDKFKKVVEERLLMYSFVNDRFMPPDDPLGRNGPTLDNFLLKEPAEPQPLPPPCPYGSKKCTYGNKCKYYHPERRSQPHKLVAEKLAEHAKQQMQEMRQKEAASQPPGEKKKLARQKTPLSRARSHNTEETTKNQLTFSFGKPQKNENDDKFREYNQKLAESRMKMEQDRVISELDIAKIPSPRTPEKRELTRSRTSGDQPGRSSPRFSELRQEGMNSPRGTSPVNLAVPGNSDKSDTGPKFLSGHLLLAKKLSDEANESDKLKKKTKSKGGDDSYSSSMSPLAYSPSKAEPVKKQPLQRVSTKDKQSLSRQRSLQGIEDPRLSQGHTSLHPSYSYDPRRLSNPQPFVGANIDEHQMLLQDFQQVQHQEMSGGMYGPIEPPNRQSSARDPSHGHAGLGRMKSAPDPFTWQQPVRQIPMMMRQNSSSDTQLNKILGQDHDGRLHDVMMSRGSSDNMSAVMKDTTGSVKFQIGGAPGQPLPQCKPSPFHSSLYSPSTQQDPRFQQQFSPEFQQHQQQQNVHFMQPQHSMPTTPQPSPCSTATMFHSSQNIHYVEPPNIWDPGPQPNITPYPPQSHQYSAGGMWPNMSNQIPAMTMAPMNLGPNQLTQMGPGQMGPHPIEAPILPSDRRYKLYTDLCRLFPEEKVRAAMNQNPNADNPNDICAYLIGAK